MSVSEKLNAINQKIRDAEKKAHRDINAVSLLAVSKKQSIEKIREAFYAGQKKFGENYLQEALLKQRALSDLDIEWHFIGSIQSNKAKLIAENFNWVHSVDRLSIAEKLNHYRTPIQAPLNICIEVNIDEEKTKSGVLPQNVFALAKQISELKHLKLRGLMIIPKNNQKKGTEGAPGTAFLLQQELISKGFSLDTLSMGMSHDFEAAIAAGSTIVRIGTAIFGER